MRLKHLIFILVSFLLFSCKTKQKAGKVSVQETSLTAERKFKSLYIKATNEAMVENYDKAIELYEECKQINPKNAAVYYELSRLYAKKRKAQLAFDNANKANELAPKNKWYLLQKAMVLNRTGQPEKAIDAFEELLTLDAKNLSVLYELAELYQREEKYKEAVNTIDRIEIISGKNPRMSYQKYMLLMDAGEVIPALDEIAALLKQDPTNGMANLAMAQHYQKSGQEEKVYDRLVFVFEDPEIRTETKLSVLMDYNKKIKEDEIARKQALTLIQIMQKVHPKDVKSYVIAGDYYTTLGEAKKANESYEKAIEYSTKSFPIFIQLMDNSYKLKEFDKLVEYANTAIESYPTQPVFYLYKGMGYKELKEYKKAISAFKTGKNVVIDDEKIEFDFLSKLGETYHSMQEYAKSDESFEKAMEINGLEPFMLNNYSYFLSLRNEKLEKAAELSKKANDIYPSNPSFNDTYGWILYQQGNYKEAERWLRKSLDNGGDESGTVLEHYGDVLLKIDGNAKRALEYWKKAKKAGDHSEELDTKIKEAK